MYLYLKHTLWFLFSSLDPDQLKFLVAYEYRRGQSNNHNAKFVFLNHLLMQILATCNVSLTQVYEGP